MMRKGPLADYPLASVLRDAAADRADGTIEVLARLSGVVQLRRGQVVFAQLDGVPNPAEVQSRAQPTREAVRRHVGAVVACLAARKDGWFRHDPLATWTGERTWLLDVDEVLDDVQARTAWGRALAPWADELLRPIPAPVTPALDADLWSVVVAMSAPTTVQQLGDRLGWDARRVATTLHRLQAAGLVDGGPPRTAAPPPPGPPPAQTSAPAGAVVPPATPTVPPASLATHDQPVRVDRSTALRRLISSLRS